MVFKRRDKRPIWKIALESLWPRGGWGRAAYYIKHRVQRLPDAPHRIARGIFAGVFTAFTPFYGLHFVIAALIARAMGGNMFAALFGTFIGNPLTYIPIGVICLKVGHYILGTEFDENVDQSLVGKFNDAMADLWYNFHALFTDATADWSNLSRFNNEVFFPYLVGGILPGLVAATICYYLSLPVLQAYQKRRRGRLKKKLEALRAQADAKPKPIPGADEAGRAP
ncbi:DUF2062 domain-containing protein [Tropicimonas sp. S265A]|uniref:DUF2062 domain-containing protein n=1 Tax=Tropicimonas sp. S265A TaxID=3415134 RepID=UPI003C7D1139